MHVGSRIFLRSNLILWVAMAPKQRRWGGKKKTDTEAPPVTSAYPASDNLAAKCAVAGLGGRRSELDMISGRAKQMDSALGTVLGGGAFYLKEFACPVQDAGRYDALLAELGDEFKQRYRRAKARTAASESGGMW